MTHVVVGGAVTRAPLSTLTSKSGFFWTLKSLNLVHGLQLFQTADDRQNLSACCFVEATMMSASARTRTKRTKLFGEVSPSLAAFVERFGLLHNCGMQ